MSFINKIVELKKYIPKITTYGNIQDMNEQIIQAEKQADYFNRKRKEEERKYIEKSKELAKIEELENSEIQRLEKKVAIISDELSDKNEVLESTLKEKEKKSLEIFQLSKKIEKLQISNQKLGQSKGGIVSTNNKLKIELEAKDQVIEEYKKLNTELEKRNNQQLETIKELKSKNDVQASKIKELSKNVDHICMEYQEDGLPKQTREILSKRKFRRKKLNKKEGKNK